LEYLFYEYQTLIPFC